jgi:hypothetical protein
MSDSKIKTNKYVGLSATSIKSYISKLKFLEKNEAFADLNTFINTNYPKINSRGAYQVAIIGTAKHSPTFAKIVGKETIDLLIKSNETVSADVRGVTQKQEKNEKQEENWVELKELKKLFKDRKAEFSIQDQLLIAFYILTPPARLDYHNVKIIRTPFIDPETELPEGIKPDDNFLRIYKKSGKNYTQLNLKEYKTSATYGDYSQRLPKAVTDIILQLPVTQNYLFETKSGGPFSTSTTFGVYLRSVFNKLTGKNISVDLLRSIYISDFRKGERSTKQKQDLATKMMNSVEVQDGYLKVKKKS